MPGAKLPFSKGQKLLGFYSQRKDGFGGFSSFFFFFAFD